MKISKYHGDTKIPFKLRITVESKREFRFLLALFSSHSEILKIVNDPESTYLDLDKENPFDLDEVKAITKKIFHTL